MPDSTPEATFDTPAPTSGPMPAAGSLGRRLAIATLAFCVVFAIVTVTVRTWYAWRHSVEAMTTELKLIDQVFQRTLSKAIWEMDREALQTQLDSAAQVAPVGRLELIIRKASGKPEVLVVKRAERSSSGLAPTLNRMLTFVPYPGAHEIVGELTLEGNESVLWARLQGEVLSIVVTQVIQSVLLAGLIMWMFNRSVTVHVEHISRHLSRISPSNLQEPLLLDRPASHRDELTVLESGVNHLQSNMSAYMDRQRRDERDLAAHRDHLAELVEERTAELQAANLRLEELSRVDALTGLANRRHFDEMKDLEFRRAKRQDQPLSVLMCDVDFFKRYNDSYGHAQGDECLRLVAQTLKGVFSRAGEFVARIGGEEFAVLLPATDLAQASVAAERLRHAMSTRGIPHTGSDAAPHVTLSIGVAQLDPSTMDRFEALMQRADEALYRAKSLGRNQVAG